MPRIRANEMLSRNRCSFAPRQAELARVAGEGGGVATSVEIVWRRGPRQELRKKIIAAAKSNQIVYEIRKNLTL